MSVLRNFDGASFHDLGALAIVSHGADAHGTDTATATFISALLAALSECWCSSSEISAFPLFSSHIKSDCQQFLLRRNQGHKAFGQ